MREMIEEAVDELLDCDGQVITVAGITFLPSEILKKMDPIAYNMAIDDYIDSQIEDLQYEIDGLDEESDADEIQDLRARIAELEDV